MVNRDGEVCAVAFTGNERGDQWPGSRVISGQKANTANAFSLPGLSLGTANLFYAVQPGGSLFGLQFSNPVDTGAAYGGQSFKHGTSGDGMVGKKIGGVNVFGGRDERYPEIAVEDLVTTKPDRVLLSSEPFPFAEQHVRELSELTGLAPDRFQLVDGEYLSWHGSRTPDGVDYAENVLG